jgi:hypothetical protein
VKTAKELVREIGLTVQPPQGVAIVLTEQPGEFPNWLAAAGIMEAALTVKFADNMAELRNTHPNVDRGEMDPRRFLLSCTPVHIPLEIIGYFAFRLENPRVCDPAFEPI